MNIVDSIECKIYKEGDIIINEGEEGEHFYIIQEGEVECLKS